MPYGASSPNVPRFFCDEPMQTVRTRWGWQLRDCKACLRWIGLGIGESQANLPGIWLKPLQADGRARRVPERQRGTYFFADLGWKSKSGSRSVFSTFSAVGMILMPASPTDSKYSILRS